MVMGGAVLPLDPYLKNPAFCLIQGMIKHEHIEHIPQKTDINTCIVLYSTQHCIKNIQVGLELVKDGASYVKVLCMIKKNENRSNIYLKRILSCFS